MTNENDILIAGIEEEISAVLNNYENQEDTVEALLELGLSIDEIEERLA